MLWHSLHWDHCLIEIVKAVPTNVSHRMGLVRHENTLPELALRKELTAIGLRYRLHRGDLPGTPDIVFISAKLATFVHGCFWHRHQRCRKATTPKSNSDFWAKKFEQNIARDQANFSALESKGWKVHLVWECEIAKDARRCADQILRIVQVRGKRYEINPRHC